MLKIIIHCPDTNYLSQSQALSAELNVPVITNKRIDADNFILTYCAEGLALQSAGPEFKKPLLIDFANGKHEFRRKQGGGKQQAIAKAIGVKGNKKIIVIDATAGFGSDAFVLASLGCEVFAIERSAIVYALLKDALQRGAASPKIADIINRIQLYHGDAANLIPILPKADVIYLDPMFPHSKNTALVKKEMRVMRALVGDEDENDKLLHTACANAKNRVVVKRPKLAPYLNQQPANLQFIGESNRFDLYLMPS